MKISLLVDFENGAPPGEFRIFKRGVNETTKGTFLFDDEAARSVMASYAKHGADLMIDLEHSSLEDPERSRAYDPDARGWFKLELRNGELWAVDVKWTPDGERRLRERTQRYISPAFVSDPKSRRVLRILNAAICAMPATDNLEPLIAATESISMADKKPPNHLRKALRAVMAYAGECGDDEKMKALLAQVSAHLADMPPMAEEDEEEKPAPAEASIAAKADEDLRKEIAALAERARKRDVVELLKATTKQTSPVFEKLAMSKTPEEVEALLACLPEKTKRGSEPQKKNEATVELTREDRRVSKILGTDPVAVLAFKQTLAARAVELNEEI